MKKGRLRIALAFVAVLICVLPLEAQKRRARNDTLYINLGNVTFRMIKVEGGEFVMGSINQYDDGKDEWRLHRVRLSRDYYLGEAEVTQGLWLEVMSGNPSICSGQNTENKPVDNVSWANCISFIQRLNEYTGMEFRMPTEAEWEFAARGGSKGHGYMYSGGDHIKAVGWSDADPRMCTRTVMRKKPNELGLYDMTGNVWEFCSDWYAKEYKVGAETDPLGPDTGEMRVSRGGAWFNDEAHCRVTYRNPCQPKLQGNGLGLRLALSCSEQIHDRKYKLKYDVRGYDNQNFALCYCSDSAVYNLRSFAYCKPGEVLNVKISPAGFVFAVMYVKRGERKVGLYSTLDGTNFHTFSFDKGEWPVDLCFTADARGLVVLLENKKLAVYDLKTNKVAREMSVAELPGKMAVSSNGYFISMVNGERVDVYNFETGALRKSLAVGKRVSNVAFSADNKRMAVLTSDGEMRLYDTRDFEVRQTVTSLGSAAECVFHPEGKYVFVITSPNRIAIVNLKDVDDRQYVESPTGGISHVGFARSLQGVNYLLFNSDRRITFHAVDYLKPDYQKMVAERADERIGEWSKQQRNESDEEYRARVSDESRLKRYDELQTEIATELAGDVVDEANVKIGKYDKKNETLEIMVDNLSPIYIGVNADELELFDDAGDLVFSNSVYTVDERDNFELKYTEVTNKNNGKKYLFDRTGKKRVRMDEEFFVPLEVIQQSSRDEIELESMKDDIVNQAMDSNLISDHTHINVKTSVEPAINADGKSIMNYNIDFNYTVDQEFSSRDDFKSGRYACTESEAASAMLRIIEKAFAERFAQYMAEGKKVLIRVYGSADASSIKGVIKYGGEYGEYENEIVYSQGELSAISVTKAGGITTNEQLAFLRAASVKHYIFEHLVQLSTMKSDCMCHVNVSKESGSEYRRIGVRFTFEDVFNKDDK